MDDPTECKVAYLAVVSHPAGETVAHLIDKFLQRRFAQRLWFAWFRSRLHFGTSSPSWLASKASRPPGSSADRDPRPQSEKGPGLRLEWESSVRRILQGSWRRVARPRRGAGGPEPLTSATPTVEKSAMTQPPPQQPPTQVFVKQRRSGCGTLLVALLVLAIITAIVIFLGASGLLGRIFS